MCYQRTWKSLCLCLDSRFLRPCLRFVLLFFFFFCFHAFLEECGYCSMNSTWTVAANVNFSQWTVHSCTIYRPTNLFFINFFIKNGSHGTIYTFKNYFATVISAISFQFQQNKSYPNRPLYEFYNIALTDNQWCLIWLKFKGWFDGIGDLLV